MKEIWDAYDETENLLGIDLVRGEVIPSEMYHIGVSVLVRHVDGDYLLTKRCITKSTWPEYWEPSAGGYALKGDTPEMAAIREVKEETGLIAKNPILVDKRTHATMIHYYYIAETDCNKTAVKLLEGETIDYMWVDTKGLIDMLDSGMVIPFQVECLAEYVQKLALAPPQQKNRY